MIVDNIQYVAFSKNLKIGDKSVRRKIEDSLSEFVFSFYSPLPPPSSNVEIMPILTGYTKNRHSRLDISGDLAKLFITFDENFRNDFDKCFNYAREKIKILTNVLTDIDTNSYSGLVIQYLFEEDNYTDDVIGFINNGSVKIVGDKHFFGFSKNFSLIYQEKIYLNFAISSLQPKNDSKLILGVSVDVNNRYANEVKGQSVSYSDVEVMEKLHCRIAQNTLDSLLTKGELRLDE